MKTLCRSTIAAILLCGTLFAQKKTAPAPTLTTRPASTTAGLPTEETVNAFMHQTFGYDSAITYKVLEIRPSPIPGLSEVMVLIAGPQGQSNSRFYVSADGKHAIAGDILPFGAQPFAEAREKLEKGVTGPAKGPAKAPVTIVEFSDLQCPHCKEANPAVEQLVAQEPNARFVFQNFPIPGHSWAQKGAEYVECVSQASNDAVWPFIKKTFEEQANITPANVDEKLKAIATEAGVKADDVATCAEKPETKARVEASLALGKLVGVTSTPTIFINGRMIQGGAPPEILKKIVDFQAAEAGTTQAKQ